MYRLALKYINLELGVRLRPRLQKLYISIRLWVCKLFWPAYKNVSQCCLRVHYILRCEPATLQRKTVGVFPFIFLLYVLSIFNIQTESESSPSDVMRKFIRYRTTDLIRNNIKPLGHAITDCLPKFVLDEVGRFCLHGAPVLETMVTPLILFYFNKS